MNRQTQWLFETPFPSPEGDFMAQPRRKLDREQIRQIRLISLEIARAIGHRARSGNSSLQKHEDAIARRGREIGNSALKEIIGSGISFENMMKKLRIRLSNSQR